MGNVGQAHYFGDDLAAQTWPTSCLRWCPWASWAWGYFSEVCGDLSCLAWWSPEVLAPCYGKRCVLPRSITGPPTRRRNLDALQRRHHRSKRHPQRRRNYLRPRVSSISHPARRQSRQLPRLLNRQSKNQMPPTSRKSDGPRRSRPFRYGGVLSLSQELPATHLKYTKGSHQRRDR